MNDYEAYEIRDRIDLNELSQVLQDKILRNVPHDQEEYKELMIRDRHIVVNKKDLENFYIPVYSTEGFIGYLEIIEHRKELEDKCYNNLNSL